jgi:hypothetical protein
LYEQNDDGRDGSVMEPPRPDHGHDVIDKQ